MLAASNPATAASASAAVPAATAAAAARTVYLGNGAAAPASPAAAVQAATAASAALAPAMAVEAAWLYRSGWPLYALADRYGAAQAAALDEQANCIAVAVYHEARGETAEGQLAVAKVIMNRAASGRYPATWCEVVKQPWQFSFVNPRTGDFPYTDQSSDSWRKAVGITRLAIGNVVPTLTNDVLWYHADYVAPSWGRRLTRVDKIGAHIFYRA